MKVKNIIPIAFFLFSQCSQCRSQELLRPKRSQRFHWELSTNIVAESIPNKDFFKKLAASTPPLDWFVTDGETLILKGSTLYECICYETAAHDRFVPFNTRNKMEKEIINHVTKNFSNKHVRLLSLGSGGCLQDLILITKLVESGLRSIDITLVEPKKECEAAYRGFTALLRKMQTIYGPGLKLSWSKVYAIHEVNKPVDVVYAIDYDNYVPGWDYSARKLTERTRTFDHKNYQASIDLMKAANLALDSENKLVVISCGKNIISLTLERLKSHFNEIRFCNELDLRKIAICYLNADIGNLPIYLEHLTKAQKPLYINKSIIREEDQAGISKFLQHYGISCTYIDDLRALEYFEQIKSQVLILDATLFDTSKGENAIEAKYANKPYISVVRFDWEKYGRDLRKFRPDKVKVYPDKAGK